VSKGISDSLNARIKTGLRSSVLQELRARRTRWRSACSISPSTPARASPPMPSAATAPGWPWAVMSALKGNAKPNAIKAIDELLTSPEFQHMASRRRHAQAGVGEAVRSFAYSKAFTKFARAVGNPRELSNRERWVLQALQVRNNGDHALQHWRAEFHQRLPASR
jgi:hypothetical protein